MLTQNTAFNVPYGNGNIIYNYKTLIIIVK